MFNLHHWDFLLVLLRENVLFPSRLGGAAFIVGGHGLGVKMLHSSQSARSRRAYANLLKVWMPQAGCFNKGPEFSNRIDWKYGITLETIGVVCSWFLLDKLGHLRAQHAAQL